jgi:hypothetical protein
MKHTETPLSIEKIQDRTDIVFICDKNGNRLFRGLVSNDVEIAKEIIRAANFHDRLLKAVKDLLPLAEAAIQDDSPADARSNDEDLEIIRDLIKEAEKEGGAQVDGKTVYSNGPEYPPRSTNDKFPVDGPLPFDPTPTGAKGEA